MTVLQTELAQQGLTLMHYKEPLKAIPKSQGYGFYGALISTLDGDKVQCHLCGGLYSGLSMHVFQKHELKARDYKDKFQLAGSTALISEKEREIRKQRQIDFLTSMTVAERESMKRKTLKMYRKWEENNDKEKQSHPHKLETKNKRGTCPDQLLQKIKEVTETLGHRPSLSEFMYATGGQRYKHLIIKTFGSWNSALKMLGYQPKTSSFKNNGYNKNFKRYSREELIEYLQIFYQENGVPPTSTDFKRGLLPNQCVYVRRFGSITNAKRIAEVPVWNRWQRERALKK